MATYMKLIFAAFIGLALAACQSPSVSENGTVYLVRHAEKVTGDAAMLIDDPRDPPLTAVGQLRAEALADRLSDAGVIAIWSTDTTRTRDTARPLADRLGLDVQLYDPYDLQGFASVLKANAGETVLVVGHSNTTPQLAEALGAEPGAPIVEASEYDRLYVVDLVSGIGDIDRYGAASAAQE